MRELCHSVPPAIGHGPRRAPRVPSATFGRLVGLPLGATAAVTSDAQSLRSAISDSVLRARRALRGGGPRRLHGAWRVRGAPAQWPRPRPRPPPGGCTFPGTEAAWQGARRCGSQVKPSLRGAVRGPSTARGRGRRAQDEPGPGLSAYRVYLFISAARNRDKLTARGCVCASLRLAPLVLLARRMQPGAVPPRSATGRRRATFRCHRRTHDGSHRHLGRPEKKSHFRRGRGKTRTEIGMVPSRWRWSAR